jgi:hypothetical protein
MTHSDLYKRVSAQQELTRFPDQKSSSSRLSGEVVRIKTFGAIQYLRGSLPYESIKSARNDPKVTVEAE